MNPHCNPNDPTKPFILAEASLTQSVLFYQTFMKGLAEKLECDEDEVPAQVQRLLGMFDELDQLRKPAPTPSKLPAKTKKKFVFDKGHAQRAASGRRAVARGTRPKLSSAIYQVMGDDPCTINDIVDRLQNKGWLPASADVGKYLLQQVKKGIRAGLFTNAPEGAGYYRTKQKTDLKFIFGEDEALARRVLTIISTRPRRARAADVARSLHESSDRVLKIILKARESGLVDSAARGRNRFWGILPFGMACLTASAEKKA